MSVAIGTLHGPLRAAVDAATQTPWWRTLLPVAAPPLQRSLGIPGPDSIALVALVDAARDGCTDATAELYRQFVDTTYRFIHWQVRDHHTTEDLTSEVWLRVVRGICGFRWEGKEFQSWILTIARNVVRDHQRAQARRPLLVSMQDTHRQFTDHRPGPEQMVLDAERDDYLQAAMQHLAAQHRQVLVLRFILELPVADTAQAMDRSVGATKVLQLRALQAISRHLPALTAA